MRVACSIPKATNTHTGCVILIAFPLQQWLHERTSLFPYTHIAYIVWYDDTQDLFVCLLTLGVYVSFVIAALLVVVSCVFEPTARERKAVFLTALSVSFPTIYIYIYIYMYIYIHILIQRNIL
jgi:Tfp pilus assembly protein PilN